MRSGLFVVRFCDIDTVLNLSRSGRLKIPDEESTNKIESILERERKSTLTKISAAINISRSTIQRRIQSKLKIRSYKISIHHELFKVDIDRRVEMAESLLPIL